MVISVAFTQIGGRHGMLLACPGPWQKRCASSRSSSQRRHLPQAGHSSHTELGSIPSLSAPEIFLPRPETRIQVQVPHCGHLGHNPAGSSGRPCSSGTSELCHQRGEGGGVSLPPFPLVTGWATPRGVNFPRFLPAVGVGEEDFGGGRKAPGQRCGQVLGRKLADGP